MGPHPTLGPTAAALVDDHALAAALEQQGRRIEQAPAARGPVAGHHIDMKAAKAPGAMIAHRRAARRHVGPAVLASEGLIAVDRVGADLGAGGPVQKAAYQALSVELAVTFVCTRPVGAALPSAAQGRGGSR